MPSLTSYSGCDKLQSGLFTKIHNSEARSLSKHSLKISIKTFTVEAGDGFRYPVTKTKRFFYLYALLALQRLENENTNGGWVEIEQIRHLPYWEKNTFLSVGKQIRRHMFGMGLIRRNIMESQQKIKGPFRMKLDSRNIRFDVNNEVVRNLLGLEKLTFYYDETKEEDFYDYVEKICKGDILFNEGNLRKALLCFNMALTKTFTIDQEITLLQRIGRILERRGEYEEAVTTYQKAIGRLKESSFFDYFLLADLNNYLAWVFYRQEKFDLAEKTYYSILSLIRGKTHHRLTGDVFNGLGKIYESRGKYKEAISFYRKALGYWCSAAYFYGVQAIYFNIGNIYSKWGDDAFTSKEKPVAQIPQEAKKKYLRTIYWAEKCMDFCDRTGVGDETSQDRILIASCYYKMNKLEKALEFAEKAEEMATKAGNKRDIIMSLKILEKIRLTLEQRNKGSKVIMKMDLVEKR
jgi:tetratricopeptide (TPR) repeat protein